VRPRTITIQCPSFLGKMGQRERLRLKYVNVFARLGSME
jgi:hypothetical protein